MTDLSPRDSRNTEGTDISIWPVLALVLLISIYPLLRNGGWWNVGGDTRNFTVAIESVLDSGDLTPAGRSIYANGYGFQALSVFLINLTGLSLPVWQVYGAILMTVWLVFPAWLLYREWLGSNRGASLATVFLFVQPELLFGIMRGTHEKFTRGLILLCLYLLTYSLRVRHKPVRFAASLLAFYLTTFALITFNNLFSGSFIAAVLLALGLSWLVARRTRLSSLPASAMRRMGYAVAIALALVFLYTFYVYDPAQHNLRLLQSITDRLAVLFLDVQPMDSFNPYSDPVFSAWTSPIVFLLLGLVNWLLLLVSGIIWTVQSVRWFLRRSGPATHPELLLWAFYGAFALQGAVAIVIDVSGALSGNLQHRIFPTIGMVGAAVIARWLLPIIRADRKVVARFAHIGLWAGVAVLSILSLLKATNEPIFSNQWQTYLPAEVRALEWTQRSLVDRSVWTGFDRRLVEVMDNRAGGEQRQIRFDQIEVEPGTDNFLVSDLIRLQVPRLGRSLPTEIDDFVTYDNGQAQIFHRRPRTPYQR